MAKIKLAGFVHTAKGRFGGKSRIVFRHGRQGGAQITSRSLWRSRRHETFAQLCNRHNWNILDLAWQHFPKHLRVLWSQCVNRRYRHPRSGLDQFRSLNLKRMHCGFPALFVPPDMGRTTKLWYPHAPSKGKSIPPKSQVILQGHDKVGRHFDRCEGDLNGIAPGWCLPQLKTCPNAAHHMNNIYKAALAGDIFTDPRPIHVRWRTDIELDENDVEFIHPAFYDHASPYDRYLKDYPGEAFRLTIAVLRCVEHLNPYHDISLGPGWCFETFWTVRRPPPRSGWAYYHKPGIHPDPEGVYQRHYRETWEHWAPETITLEKSGRGLNCGPAIGDKLAWTFYPLLLHFNLMQERPEPPYGLALLRGTMLGDQEHWYESYGPRQGFHHATIHEGLGDWQGYWQLNIYLTEESEEPEMIFRRSEWGMQNGKTGIYSLGWLDPETPQCDTFLELCSGQIDWTDYAAPDVRLNLRKLVWVLAYTAALGISLVAAKRYLEVQNFDFYTYDFTGVFHDIGRWDHAPAALKANILERMCNPHSMAMASDHDLRHRIAYLAECAITDTTAIPP